MPRISASGRVTLCGPGDGPKRRWRTAVSTVEQDCSSGVCVLVERNVLTGERITVDGKGANFLAAGGGTWAARAQDGTGYRDSHGREHADWFPLEVDAQTGAVLVSNYAGPGLWLLYPDAVYDVDPAAVLDVQQADFDKGIAVYRSGGQIRRWPDGAVFPLAADDVRYADGNLVLSYGGLWFVPWDRPERSLFLSGDACDFNPDICTLASGLVLVVSSRTSGEGEGDLRTYEINPVLGTVNGKAQPFLGVRRPRLLTTARPMVVLTFDDPQDPNTLTGYDATGQRDWPTDASTAGVMVTWPNDPPAIRDAQHARAVRLGKPFVFYADQPGLTPNDVPGFIGARRLPAPRTRITRSREADAASLTEEVRALRAAGLDVLIDIQLTRGFQGPGQYAWTEQDIVDRAVDAANVGILEGAVGFLLFNYARLFKGELVDGIARWPLFQRFVADLKAATPDWRTFPKGGAPKPTPAPTPVPAPTPAPIPKDDYAMKTITGFLHTDDGHYVIVNAVNELRLTKDKSKAVQLDLVVLDQAKQIVELQRHDNGLPVSPLRAYPPYDLENPAVLVTPGVAMRWHAGPGLEFKDQYAFGDVDPNGPFYLGAEHAEGALLTMEKDSQGPQHRRAWKFELAGGAEHVGPF